MAKHDNEYYEQLEELELSELTFADLEAEEYESSVEEQLFYDFFDGSIED